MAGRLTLRRALWLAGLGLVAALLLRAARTRRPLPASPPSPYPVAPPLPYPLEEDTEENTRPLPLAAEDTWELPLVAPAPTGARPRQAGALAFWAIAAALGAYHALASRLPDASTWGDVAIVGLLVIPATFALVGLALPLRGGGGRRGAARGRGGRAATPARAER